MQGAQFCNREVGKMQKQTLQKKWKPLSTVSTDLIKYDVLTLLFTIQIKQTWLIHISQRTIYTHTFDSCQTYTKHIWRDCRELTKSYWSMNKVSSGITG